MQPAGQSAIELELTYLAKEIPRELEGATPRRLIDVYVPDTVDHPTLRLRQRETTYEITKKIQITAGDASVHQEMTIPLDANEFNALAVGSNRRVVKDRYNVMIEGHPAEVDVFLEGLQGLVVIDFEFANEIEKSVFQPPAVCLRDVTQEEFIAGGKLAGKTYMDIQPQLEQLGYAYL